MAVTGVTSAHTSIYQYTSVLLRQGSRGTQVRDLQEALRAAGFDPGPVDGVFGPRTRAAVLAFQRAHGLAADGIAGPVTKGALARVVRDGVEANPPSAPDPIPPPGASGVNPSEPPSFQIPSVTLRSGSRGSSVRLLQAALTALGFDPGTIDGVFGSRTRAAVLAFQRARGLAADGIVGPKTWAALAGQSVQAPAPATDPTGYEPMRDIDALAALPVPGPLSCGESGSSVRALQRILDGFGLYPPNRIDGDYGPRTQRGVQYLQRILRDAGFSTPTDGTFGAETAAALRSLLDDRAELEPVVERLTGYAPGLHFPPFSDEARALFREAAALVGLPSWWADEAGLHNILRRESGGYVGRTNYTYGAGMNIDRWREIHDELRRGRISARSSATGIGQFLLANVDAHYPGGRTGIGNPLQEAAGMLLYIASRYGTPAAAWRFYTDPNKPHEGY
jgi:peptidoglycan hydrolase-like protein with peptidoglycan-binding domain